jgi:4-hydroxy-2-oxoheptanedioate aldolase
MGYPGQVNHPEVVAAIENGIERLQAVNVPAGVMALDVDMAKHFMAKGALFTAVGVDLVILAQAVANLREQFD